MNQEMPGISPAVSIENRHAMGGAPEPGQPPAMIKR